MILLCRAELCGLFFEVGRGLVCTYYYAPERIRNPMCNRMDGWDVARASASLSFFFSCLKYHSSGWAYHREGNLSEIKKKVIVENIALLVVVAIPSNQLWK